MTTERNAQGVDGAERDARTIYDIAMIREEMADATREDVEFKVIALRNFQFVAAVAELIAAGREYRRLILSLQAGNSVPFGTLDDAAKRLDAALSNIEGGKA